MSVDVLNTSAAGTLVRRGSVDKKCVLFIALRVVS